MRQLLGLIQMLVSEHLIAGDLARKPEELLVMDTQDQVTAWHKQGEDEGPIAPVYLFNALACSALVPEGGTVVDLGCGSGRFAAYLARYRTDLRIIGLDLSGPMVDVGNESLRNSGLSDRVELKVGDMTTFSAAIPPDTSLVSCVFALHHLPTLDHVNQCFEQFHRARSNTGCAAWIFDLARPRHARTAELYPEVFTPDAPEVFKLDSMNSLLAAYSHEEIKQAATQVFHSEPWHSRLARIFPLYQAFWLDHRMDHTGVQADRYVPPSLSPELQQQYRGLKLILPGVPGQH